MVKSITIIQGRRNHPDHPDRGLGVIWAIQKFSAISKNIRHRSVGQTDQKLQLIIIFGPFLDQVRVYLSEM